MQMLPVSAMCVGGAEGNSILADGFTVMTAARLACQVFLKGEEGQDLIAALEKMIANYPIIKKQE